eukprot:CAMPEP_0184727872 /NCGR_PEP_ID=MMETSP0314-20130426/37682_1 /TAXON_ID=38298 /ORGANISM="Rhodella maculata, Strain CCMP 736" /LENGTH=51 /DNA_ID=CAMNT_0027193567 /DNA_START=24 /DNA_END=175 /DNA_ORIENTATION=-
MPTPSPAVWQTFFNTPPEDVLFQDAELVVIRDRTPRAAVHLLVIPRHQHIR